MRLPSVALVALATGCGSAPPAAQTAQPDTAEPSAASAIAPGAIKRAAELIWQEPAVRNLDYRPANAVQWIVAVEDDGSPRFGFAETICGLLGEAGARDDRSAVRIANAKLQATLGEDARDASLGAVRCSDAGQLDDAPAVGA